jgi:hypothetical protein
MEVLSFMTLPEIEPWSLIPQTLHDGRKYCKSVYAEDNNLFRGRARVCVCLVCVRVCVQFGKLKSPVAFSLLLSCPDTANVGP